jgi:hypothetical protein
MSDIRPNVARCAIQRRRVTTMIAIITSVPRKRIVRPCSP